jgi:hypothetical protein
MSANPDMGFLAGALASGTEIAIRSVQWRTSFK